MALNKAVCRRMSYNTPKCTLVVFDIFRVFYKRNLNVS